MNESTESSAEGLLEAWRQRIAAFRIHPSQLSYIDYGKVVASGGFGQVKKAVYTKRTRNRSSAVSPTAPNSKAAGITVAVKTLQIHMEVDKERLEKRFMREAYVWSQLKNDHILDFLGFYFSCAGGKTEALLVCPWMENGQSVSYVKQQRLRPAERLHLLLDAAKGLQYLHSRVPPICHGDIKGSNVLIKNDGRAAICDFGLAQVLDEEFERLASQTIHRGTVRWTSPERLDDNGPLAPSSDVWSWAWLIWEFMTEKIPFHLVNNASAVIFHIVTLKFPAYEQEITISEVPTLSKLMQLCWQKEPESRLRMEECIERIEHILEGFEPPEPVGKDQKMSIGTSTLFQPTVTPSFPPGPPPPAESNTPSDRLGSPTGIIPPSPPGALVPPAYPGPIIPQRSDKSRKDLPPIPGQDDEAPILTTFDSSHEQRTDLEPNWGAKTRSTNVPDHPPSAFTFKGLRSFKTSSSESSSKAAAIGLKKLTKRLLPSSKRKPQRGNDSDDDEWDWDIIPGPSSSQPPQNITGSNPDPSYHVNSDGADLRQQIDYIMRTLQRLESSQAQQSGTQQDITNYLRQVDGWFSGAPVFGSPYVSRLPPPIFIPPGQPPIASVHFGPAWPFIPTPTAWASPASSPVSSTRTGPPVQPHVIVQQPAQQPAQPTVVQIPAQIVQPVPTHQPRVQRGPHTVIESLPGPSPQHTGSPVSSTSSHPRDHRFPGGPQIIRVGAGLPIIRQFKRSEIQLEPEDEFDRKEESQRGVILETGKAIAIKPVNFQLEGGRTASERALMSELHGLLSLWGSLEPEHIAKVVGSAFVNGVPWVITEWCSSGNLTEYLEKTPRADRRSLLRQVAQGVNYLHTASPRMIHSNLKPNNILIDDGRVKLADIGIMGFLETQNAGAEIHGTAGDARWTAPEVLEGRHHRWRADIYSFGCVALFILKDELPYVNLRSDVAVLKAIYRGDLPTNREAASALHSTWKLCWAQDLKRRPNMSTILESVREPPVRTAQTAH
ncbi:hypothetical protein FRC00_001537 [Tulasnella sp. 408]|nr:hypothetical protein FRC00_001537 [Tulasnella sp. 408]